MEQRIPAGLTALHHLHIELDAAMEEIDGWMRPATYGDPAHEAEAARRSAGLMDISPVSKLSLHGTGAADALAEAFPGTAGAPVGGVRSVPMPSGDDGPEPLAAVLVADEVMLVAGASNAEAMAAAIPRGDDRCAHLTNLTSAYAALRVIGPDAGAIVAGVTDLDTSPSGFPDMTCAQGAAAQVHCLLMRNDQGGLPAYDLFVARELGEHLWGALLDAGSLGPLTPIGVRAMELLRKAGS